MGPWSAMIKDPILTMKKETAMEKKDKKPVRIPLPEDMKKKKETGEETLVNEKIRKKFNLNEGTKILME